MSEKGKPGGGSEEGRRKQMVEDASSVPTRPPNEELPQQKRRRGKRMITSIMVDRDRTVEVRMEGQGNQNDGQGTKGGNALGGRQCGIRTYLVRPSSADLGSRLRGIPCAEYTVRTVVSVSRSF